MDTSKKESDIAPLIPDESQQENPKIINKSSNCCNFLECGMCSLIVIFTCFKP